MNDVIKGRKAALHMLHECRLPGFERSYRLVNFQGVFALPIDFVRKQITVPHLRLLPPYREQLAQNFARFFMRVGLPQDIPPLAKNAAIRDWS
jgi:hypothetical protein